MTTANPGDILVVDDEPQIRRMLRMTLEDRGYAVREAAAGRLALAEITLKTPQLVILDLGLPDLNGIEVLQALRRLYTFPVLILSILGQEDNKISALDAGADDYLTKPFAGGELLARIRALFRRTVAPKLPEPEYRFGSVHIDFEQHRVSRAGKRVRLTAIEYRLLRMLVMNRDKVLTHRAILSEIWGPNFVDNTNYLRIYIMNLRRKLGEEAGPRSHFQTELGTGYRFVSRPEDETA
jgi:two-component system, OmpR family, KDP operon response regulator KdpE